jgi:hypothetical protein
MKLFITLLENVNNSRTSAGRFSLNLRDAVSGFHCNSDCKRARDVVVPCGDVWTGDMAVSGGKRADVTSLVLFRSLFRQSWLLSRFSQTAYKHYRILLVPGENSRCCRLVGDKNSTSCLCFLFYYLLLFCCCCGFVFKATFPHVRNAALYDTVRQKFYVCGKKIPHVCFHTCDKVLRQNRLHSHKNIDNTSIIV